MRWQITVMTRDGKQILFADQAEDLKEVQALATEARSQCLSAKIWIRKPTGEVYSWD
jgi:hypothetical protein